MKISYWKGGATGVRKTITLSPARAFRDNTWKFPKATPVKDPADWNRLLSVQLVCSPAYCNSYIIETKDKWLFLLLRSARLWATNTENATSVSFVGAHPANGKQKQTMIGKGGKMEALIICFQRKTVPRYLLVSAALPRRRSLSKSAQVIPLVCGQAGNVQHRHTRGRGIGNLWWEALRRGIGASTWRAESHETKK